MNIRQAVIGLLSSSLILTACGPSGEERGPGEALARVAAATIEIEVEGTFADFGSGEQIQSYRGGTAFFIDSSGIAVTNNHVVAGAAIIRVYLPGESAPRNARLLGTSECSDLAVIQVNGSDFAALSWFSGEVTPGKDIYAAGYPDGGYTVTRGIVSRVDSSSETEWASVDGVLEHDARILPGNSGGPLVTTDGRVIGVNYASTDFVTQSWAIGVDRAEALVERMRQGEDIDSIGVNGIAFADVEDDISGVWVTSVQTGSSAFAAGVKAGDVITRLENIPLGRDGTMADYCDIIRSNQPGSELQIEIFRPTTEQFLEGTLNGSRLEESFSFAGSRGGFVGEDYDYEFVTDDSGRIAVEVPTAWADIDGRSFIDDSGNEIFDVIIAEDVQAFIESFDVSGVRISASYDLARTTNELNILEEYFAEFSELCTYVQTEAYEDPLYLGEYDLYSDCLGTGADFYVVAVVPKTRAFVVWIEATVRSDADLLALDRILDTFIFE